MRRAIWTGYECAGSVFVGRWSAQPMGDYISGPNHTLPTGGMARVRGGLSVNDFVKLITVQEYASARHAARWAQRPRCWPKPKDWWHTRRQFGCDCSKAPREPRRCARERRARGMKPATAVASPTPRARVQAMKEYHPPLGNRDALRLDFNENTIACSPEGAGSAWRGFPLAISRAIRSASRWSASWPSILASRRSRWC